MSENLLRALAAVRQPADDGIGIGLELPMSQEQSHEKIHGPYQHGNRWRIVIVAGNGERRIESHGTPEAAIARVNELRATVAIRSLRVAVTAYLETRSARERATVESKLASFLTLDDRPLVALTPAAAREIHRECQARVNAGKLAAATLRTELGYARRFAAWCVERGWLRVNPFAELESPKHVNRGKPKLRVNASKQFLAYLVTDHSVEATAVLTAFGLGLRASAVVNRLVEDLDDDGHLLWIRDDKTRAGDREIEVPDYLRVRLLRLTNGRAPHDRLFGDMSRFALHYHTVRLCRLAGVPRVTPQGLRGSAATNAVRLGGRIDEVARAIGHADGGATLRRHYLAGGAEESARGRQIADLVAAIPDVPVSDK